MSHEGEGGVYLLFVVRVKQNRIRKDTSLVKKYAKVRPVLCAEGHDECQFYQAGEHARMFFGVLARKAYHALAHHRSSQRKILSGLPDV